MKRSFKDFLLEVDQGDFELRKDVARRKEQEKERTKDVDAFQQKVRSSYPSQGDVIYAAKRDKYYRVVKNTPEGLIASEIGGDGKKIRVPRKVQFQRTGKSTKGGNPIYTPKG